MLLRFQLDPLPRVFQTRGSSAAGPAVALAGLAAAGDAWGGGGGVFPGRGRGTSVRADRSQSSIQLLGAAS